MRTIKQIQKAVKVNMGGVILDQALPVHGIDQIDPFLLIHHWYDRLAGGQVQSEVGVGPHPHRGFSPVTFIFKGGVHHRDSLGTSEVVRAGGTQWMNSGRGIVHSERPERSLAEDGGEFEIIQFWLNTPSLHKMKEASYQPLSEDATPLIEDEKKRSKLFLVAGKQKGITGPLKAESEVLIMRGEAKSGAKIEIELEDDFNALIYILDGKIQKDNVEADDKTMVEWNQDGSSISFDVLENTRFILLSGAPINESLSTYGPFVMNTEDEIRQAIMDYQSGKMGILREEFE